MCPLLYKLQDVLIRKEFRLSYDQKMHCFFTTSCDWPIIRRMSQYFKIEFWSSSALWATVCSRSLSCNNTTPFGSNPQTFYILNRQPRERPYQVDCGKMAISLKTSTQQRRTEFRKISIILNLIKRKFEK